MFLCGGEASTKGNSKIMYTSNDLSNQSLKKPVGDNLQYDGKLLLYKAINFTLEIKLLS